MVSFRARSAFKNIPNGLEEENEKTADMGIVAGGKIVLNGGRHSRESE